MKSKHTTRTSRGSYIAEFGPALFILIVSVFLPLTNLVAIATRTALINDAVQQTAAVAARCKTFDTSISASELSSKVSASSTFSSLATRIGGFQPASVQTSIITTNISSGASTVRTTRLTSPADTNVNVYAIRVTATGSVSPLITCSSSWFSNVPGLTSPFTFTSTASSYSECTQGLNQ